MTQRLEKPLFHLTTEIIDYDLEASNGWTPDCNNKQDYDPIFVTGDSRVYPDGDYICRLSIGETELIVTPILSADTPAEAKVACEQWMEQRSHEIANLLKMFYQGVFS